MKTTIVQPITESEWPRVLQLRRRAQADGGRTLARNDLDFLRRAVATNRRRFAGLNDQVLLQEAKAQ